MKALISSQPCPTWAVIIEEEDTAYPLDPSEIARSLLAVTSWSALGLDETDVEVSSDEEDERQQAPLQDEQLLLQIAELFKEVTAPCYST